MPLPTTATGPTNVYLIEDDPGFTANSPGAGTGGGSGAQIVTEFVAPNAASAITVAHIIASALQRPVRVISKFTGVPPWTLVLGAAAQVALTQVPSGVGY
jgi:hypothetical protein